MNSARLSDLDLGYSNAEMDARERPAFLKDAFVDPGGLVDACLFGTTSVILGSKGTGKSALGRHLMLSKEAGGTSLAPQMFVLRDLIPAPSPDRPGPYTEWRILLLCLLLGEVVRDNESWIERNTRKRVDELLSAQDLPPLASTKSRTFASSIALRTPLLSLNVKSEHQGLDAQRADLVDALREAARLAQSPRKRHVVILDGVDDLLLWGESGLRTIAALVDDLFWLCNSDIGPHRFLLLCSDDVFKRIGLKNKNKMVQDRTQVLLWYARGDDPGRLLFDLVRRRAEACGTSWEAIKEESFPSEVAPGLPKGEVEDLLLDYTRYNPRDLLMLLKHIGMESKAVDKVEWKSIARGIQSYCTEYFIPELQDELVGYLDVDVVNLLFDRLRVDHAMVLDKDRFAHDEADLEKGAQLTFLTRLFECGALGGASEGSGRPPDHFSFSERDARINGFAKLSLHVALQAGLRIHPVEWRSRRAAEARFRR